MALRLLTSCYHAIVSRLPIFAADLWTMFSTFAGVILGASLIATLLVLRHLRIARAEQETL